MISVGMVCNGYLSDLKKNQIHDAIVQETSVVNLAGEKARRVTCTGHSNGKTITDIAVITVHADRVYILSADSDQTGCNCAKKTLDSAVASVKWVK